MGIFGHCGDGNLHVNFMYNEESEQETAKAVHALHQLMKKVIALGGAISGEHGVGLAKTPFVRDQFMMRNGILCLLSKSTRSKRNLESVKFLMSLNHGIKKRESCLWERTDP